MSVELQRQALITDRNLDLPVVLQRQALLVDGNLDIRVAEASADY